MATNDTYLKGFNEVITRLKKESAIIKGKTMAGLIEASVIIQRDMETTSPKVPVDTGNLRSSWFRLPYYTIKGPSLNIGFTANYATFVHEMVDKGEINWNREGSGPKFFEEALKRNEKKILETIRNKARIK